jgi:protein AFG1
MLRSSRVVATPSKAYSRMIGSGAIRHDERQVIAMKELDRVYNDLLAFKKSPKGAIKRDVAIAPPSHLGHTPFSFFQKAQKVEAKKAAGVSVMHPLSDVKGLYMYGGVGCGKTMMMDILYNEAPIEKKMRVHFHQFMLDVHSTMHSIRQKKRSDQAAIDPFDEVAQRMVTSAELLCFDELVIADISDAMIMRRLFDSFYRIGVCAVFTSNRRPDELYKGGLNRESFLPFISLIKDRCVVYNLDSTVDYRLSGQAGETYLAPMNSENDRRFDETIKKLTKGERMVPRTLRVFGRDVRVPRSAGGVCQFTFAELCGSELSTADYSVIAKAFHTMLLEHVPAIGPNDSDVKRRFIALVDTLYQHKVKLVVYAEVAPQMLESTRGSTLLSGGLKDTEQHSVFEIGQLVNEKEGSFQMERCVSRLVEMSSVEYLRAPHKEEEIGLGVL